MLDFVYVVTFEYEDEFEVVGAAGLYQEAKDLIGKIIDNLPAKDNTEERKNKDNYYITGTAVFTEYKGHLYN
jgi:hypothetical protein